MPITAVDKVKINKYLKEHSIGDIYYIDLCDALAKRGKISDIEFIEYFTDYTINEFRKNEKISIKHLTKIILTIESFLEWIHDGDSDIPEETIDKIRNFENFYDDYLNRNEFDIDIEFTDNCIQKVLETLNKLYPSNANNDLNIKYINQINELNEQIKMQKKELDKITKLYEKLQEENNQKSNKLDLLNNDFVLHEGEINKREKELEKLNELIKSLNNKINELGNLLSLEQAKNISLTNYKEQYENIKQQLEECQRMIEIENEQKNQINELEIKQTAIESLIYKKLLFEQADINEILKYIEEKGFITGKDEIYNLLKQMRKKINIESNNFLLSPKYKIINPKLPEDREFLITIPNGLKYYNILLVSDFHIEEFSSDVLSDIEKINEYSVKNNIHLILNLGDFYNGVSTKNLNYEDAIKNYEIIEQTILKIPKIDGLYHAILGGNHERNISNYGFDPIKILSEEREDIINLGYKHSTITLNTPKNILGKFDIHHPDNFDFSIELDSTGIDMDDLNNYLNNIYNKQNRTRDDSYIDILGHTHKSQFNYLGSYYYIPSFFEGKTRRGACHLRIYFDENKQIKYMVFMPLAISNQLIKNNEIIYKKILTKNK